jgi:hypothetical protein
MYVVQGQACTVANGSDPVTPAQIAAGLANLALINGPANLAQSTFNALISRTDLNTNGWPIAEFGGVPAGPGGANPIGGKATGFRSWPGGRGARACLATRTPPMGANPASLPATAAPPPPKTPSLVTQGHPTYTPPPAKPNNAPLPVMQETTAWNPPNTGYSEESAGAFAPATAASFGTFNAAGQKISNTLFSPQGMGCGPEENSFWPGLISGLSLLASGLVLYEWLKKNSGSLGF